MFGVKPRENAIKHLNLNLKIKMMAYHHPDPSLKKGACPPNLTVDISISCHWYYVMRE